MSLTSFIQEKEVREKFLQTFSTPIIEANKPCACGSAAQAIKPYAPCRIAARTPMILSADGKGPKLGRMTRLTNEISGDAELGTVRDGGSDIPVVYGRREYSLSPQVKQRGWFYATHTVKQLLESDPSVSRFGAT